jgi:hypothetical protein
MNKFITNRVFLSSDFDFLPFYVKYADTYSNNILPSNNFLYWFIGFTEVRGSFIVNNRGDLTFFITWATSDIKILRRIRETLGFGNVVPHSNTISKYVACSKKEIEVLISLFNKNIILPTKRNELRLFIKGFNSWVTKGYIRLEPIKFSYNFILPSLDNSWLSGFTDGKGTFTCSINACNYTFVYNIAQKRKDNLIVLKQINALFGAGRVYKDRTKDIYEYRISGIRSCSNIFPYFDKYELLTNKSQCYVLWKELHKDLVNKYHLDKEKKIKIVEKTRKMKNKWIVRI